jgi:MFS family permease
VSGELFAASRARPGLRLLVIAAFAFGAGCAVAAASPRAWMFGAVLIGVGVAAQTLLTSGNSLVQLTTEPAMRGRVMAILMAIALGGTPIGSPLVGWVVNAYGARWGMAVGVAGGLAAAVVGLVALMLAGGRKVFFFEKKNQKTFATLPPPVAASELK